MQEVEIVSRKCLIYNKVSFKNRLYKNLFILRFSCFFHRKRRDYFVCMRILSTFASKSFHLLHRDGIYIFHITQCISRIYKKTSIVKVTNIPQQSKYIYSYIFVIFFKRAITVRI